MLCLPGLIIMIFVVLGIIITVLQIMSGAANGNVGANNLFTLLIQIVSAIICMMLIGIFCANDVGIIILWILAIMQILGVLFHGGLAFTTF